MADVQAINSEPPNNSYDGYPFEEWSDLSEGQKRVLAASRIGNALSGQVNPGIAEKAIRDARSAAMQTEDARAMAHIVTSAVNAAHRQQREHEVREAQRKAEDAVRNSAAAGSGVLLAEGSMLRVAMAHVEGRTQRYERQVSFNRPIPQYACLYGDQIALGGDMLTGCTVTDTEPKEIRVAGETKTIYVAKAIST